MAKGGDKTEKTKKKQRSKNNGKTNLKVKVIKAKKKKADLAEKEEVSSKKGRSAQKRTGASRQAAKKTTEKKKAKRPEKNKREASKRSSEKIEPRVLYERVEREKSFVIKTAVTFIMLAIVAVWMFTLKTSLTAVNKSGDDSLNYENLKDLTESVSLKMEELNDGLQSVASYASDAERLISDELENDTEERRSPFEEASSTMPLLIEKLNSLANASGTEENIEKADIEALKKRIEELEKKLEE